MIPSVAELPMYGGPFDGSLLGHISDPDRLPWTLYVGDMVTLVGGRARDGVNYYADAPEHEGRVPAEWLDHLYDPLEAMHVLVKGAEYDTGPC